MHTGIHKPLRKLVLPELRVVVPKGLNELLNQLVEAELFATKADVVRASIVYFLKDLRWLKKLEE